MNEFTPISTPILAVRGADSTSLISDLAELTKARLTTLVMITTFVGFTLASGGHLDWIRLIHTVLATGLVAGAAAVLNQIIEIRADGLMERTRNRPLPSGRVSRPTAMAIGTTMAVAGLFYLAAATTFLATYLAGATLGIYLCLYTPMKRLSSFCVPVGAIAGAIPPVIGWTAVDGSLGGGAWMLFGVLFAWQMPHFLAIAWMYREQYARAGFHMLRRTDKTGWGAAAQSLLFATILTAITLIPLAVRNGGVVYLAGALAADGLLIVYAFRFLSGRTQASARRLFFVSILYLPAILGLMIYAIR